MNELTDLEICKRIAEIEDERFIFRSGEYYTLQWDYNYSRDEESSFDPLTDDALLMGLIKKYIQSYRYDVYTSPESETPMHIFKCFHNDEVSNSNYAKAALLAIIEAHT